MSILNNLSPQPKQILNEITDRLILLDHLLDAEEIEAFELFSVLKIIEKSVEASLSEDFIKQAIRSIEYTFRDKDTIKSKGFQISLGKKLYDYSNANNYQPYQDALDAKAKADAEVKAIEKELVGNLAHLSQSVSFSITTGEQVPHATVKGNAKPSIKVII